MVNISMGECGHVEETTSDVLVDGIKPTIVHIDPERMVEALRRRKVVLENRAECIVHEDPNYHQGWTEGEFIGLPGKHVCEGILRTSNLPQEWINDLGGFDAIDYDASAFEMLSIGSGRDKDRSFVGKPIVGRALRGDPRAMNRRLPVERQVVRLFVNFAFCGGTNRLEVLQRALDMCAFMDALRSVGHQTELYVLEFGESLGKACRPRVIMVKMPTNPIDMMGFLGMTGIRGVFHAFMKVDHEGNLLPKGWSAHRELAYEHQRNRLRKVLGASNTDYIINMPFSYRKGWLLDQLQKSQEEVAGGDPLGILDLKPQPEPC